MSYFTSTIHCYECGHDVEGPDLFDIKFRGDCALGCGHFVRLTDDERLKTLCEIVGSMESMLEDLVQWRQDFASQGT